MKGYVYNFQVRRPQKQLAIFTAFSVLSYLVVQNQKRLIGLPESIKNADKSRQLFVRPMEDNRDPLSHNWVNSATIPRTNN
ncbi:hypothetical protein ABK040_002330 [Willaertia magna]